MRNILFSNSVVVVFLPLKNLNLKNLRIWGK